MDFCEGIARVFGIIKQFFKKLGEQCRLKWSLSVNLISESHPIEKFFRNISISKFSPLVFVSNAHEGSQRIGSPNKAIKRCREKTFVDRFLATLLQITEHWDCIDKTFPLSRCGKQFFIVHRIFHDPQIDRLTGYFAKAEKQKEGNKPKIQADFSIQVARWFAI